MGSFDAACSVSGLTIHCGDPVAYIPMQPSKYQEYKISDSNSNLIYPWCYYVPVGLPIFGKYYDYGYIDEIEENEATKSLCEHFNCDIATMVGEEGDLPCSGMFVHREVYNALITEMYDEWGGRIEHSTRARAEGRYDQWAKFAEIAVLSRESDDIKLLLGQYEYKQAMASFFGPQIEFETIAEVCNPLVEKKVLKKEMIDFRMFISALHACNVFFFPSMNGYQHGNDYQARTLFEASLSIAKKNIEKSEKERAEDE